MLVSSGLLMIRFVSREMEFFLVHPGGPYYQAKNEGAWGIPKGLVDAGESLMDAAQREFFEETGIKPMPPFFSLDAVKLKSGKIVHAWAFAGDWNSGDGIKSNFINLQWPPNSGRTISIPEIDKAEWMTVERAKKMMTPAQIPFLERARERVKF